MVCDNREVQHRTEPNRSGSSKPHLHLVHFHYLRGYETSRDSRRGKTNKDSLTVRILKHIKPGPLALPPKRGSAKKSIAETCGTKPFVLRNLMGGRITRVPPRITNGGGDWGRETHINARPTADSENQAKRARHSTLFTNTSGTIARAVGIRRTRLL